MQSDKRFELSLDRYSRLRFTATNFGSAPFPGLNESAVVWLQLWLSIFILHIE
jgi:hypothetical protein